MKILDSCPGFHRGKLGIAGMTVKGAVLGAGYVN
jgi:hypothetical protein